MTSPRSGQNIRNLLDRCASDRPGTGITAYVRRQTRKRTHTGQGVTTHEHERPLKQEHLTYGSLRALAVQRADLLHDIEGVVPGKIILIHFASQMDTMVWFWSTLLAHCIPAISTPLVGISEGRRRHFKHLKRLLSDPICITKQEIVQADFGANEDLNVIAVESLNGAQSIKHEDMTTLREGLGPPSTQRPAALMLTSGSSGNAKAVSLSHDQIYAAMEGKTAALPTPKRSALLNWIGLDHVASLVEIHLCAMYLGVDQIHVPATAIVPDPLLLLRLLSEHRVSRTFAPNFLLCKIQKIFKDMDARETESIDLCNLRYVCSGGEPNNVEACSYVSQQLHLLGAPTENVVVPGFGMTETCAGCIFNTSFPDYDLKEGNEFAAIGFPVPGLEMRVSPHCDADTGNETATNGTDPGALEVRGPIVFQSYFNDAQATETAFTNDGWFKTGDMAQMGKDGALRLIGRSKEVININGVKYLPHEVEAAIIEADIPGLNPSYVCCFAHRQAGSSTEEIYIVYQYTYAYTDAKARTTALHTITRTILLLTGSRPQVLPLPPGTLHKTSLGKLSRAKIQSSLEQGQYKDQELLNTKLLKSYQDTHCSKPKDGTERSLQTLFHKVLGSTDLDLGVETSFLQRGVSSVELVQLKSAVEKAFYIADIPIITLLTNTTIRSLAQAIQEIQSSRDKPEYDPVVILQDGGHGTPLWLIHPGIGEILVFLGLVKYLTDRPVYALRARGFNGGEAVFESLSDVLDTYYTAIKKLQPHGPYALAGYSYGSMIAFEISKQLEANNDNVQFLGSFNLPPHIKERMKTLDWTAGLQHIAHFCGIITEQRSEELLHELRGLAQSKQVSKLLAESDPGRCAELGLTQASLLTWINVAWALQKIGWHYDPSGSVKSMDVFYCQPLKVVAKTRHEYRTEKLDRWRDFVRADVRFHEVDGEHYTMIGADHVFKFQRTLRKALRERGL